MTAKRGRPRATEAPLRSRTITLTALDWDTAAMLGREAVGRPEASAGIRAALARIREAMQTPKPAQ
jgi:hypothetical protein